MDEDKDSWEPWVNELYDRRTGRELQATVRIRYRDAEGRRTLRDVQIERYFHDHKTGNGAIAGYCKLRHSRRVFRFDRINEPLCMRTQRPISDLGAWLDQEYQQTPLFARDRFIEVYGVALGALHAIAKADGAFRAPERALLDEFMQANGLSDPKARALVLADMDAWRTPSARDFGKDLRGLDGAALDLRQEVFDFAERMIASDKTTREAEHLALERLRKQLKLPPRKPRAPAS